MPAAVHLVRWLTDTLFDIIRIDPVGMARDILTGIGCAGPGVIFREGFNIRGLATAASLWITVSLGILFGVGFHASAVIGAIATVLVVAAGRFTEARLPRRAFVDMTLRQRRGPEATTRQRLPALPPGNFCRRSFWSAHIAGPDHA